MYSHTSELVIAVAIAHFVLSGAWEIISWSDEWKSAMSDSDPSIIAAAPMMIGIGPSDMSRLVPVNIVIPRLTRYSAPKPIQAR